MSLAAALIASRSREPHWDDRARQLLAGLMAYVCTAPGETATLPRVFDMLALPPDDFRAKLAHILSNNRLPLVRSNLGWFMNEGNEAESIRSAALGQLNFLLDNKIRRFLSASSFSFEELRRPKTSLYFVLSPEFLGACPSFARFFIQSFFTSTTREPSPDDASILMILDEQAKLGYMKVLEDSVAMVRKHNVRLWSIFQDLTQLQAIFPERWSTILSCAGVQQYFTVNDLTTAEFISKQVGTCTRIITTHSTNEGQSTSRSEKTSNVSQSSGMGISTGVQGVPFLRPQDFYGMHATARCSGCAV